MISLGDIVDRGPYPFRCMDTLDKLAHKILIRGNHDLSFFNWLNGERHDLGGAHGSSMTMVEWTNHTGPIMKQFIKKFLSEQIPYYVDRHNFVYVHGGFEKEMPIKDHSEYHLCWDRELWNEAVWLHKENPESKLHTIEGFKKIFIGHSPVQYLFPELDIPVKCAGVWNLDTGCGKGGKLTIMDAVTEEYWQSD